MTRSKLIDVKNREIKYTELVGCDHIKSLGQYFTNYKVAQFMCSWACVGARSMLDPAVGNSVFLRYAKQYSPDCALTGYEIDEKALNFFGNPSNANISNKDYLMDDWDTKYDAIVCNPPYNRFQAVTNRNEILEKIYSNTGVKYSSYTNQYILFLLKSIHQLSFSGRLAYLIPTEFLNSKYGMLIKDKLIKERLVYAIINFKNNNELFYNATTTCCIILIDRTVKQNVVFYNLQSILDLDNIHLFQKDTSTNATLVPYEMLNSGDKWRMYINQEETVKYSNLTDVSNICKISRGIATGANEFFCLSKSMINDFNIPSSAYVECICHSSDVKNAIFKQDDFRQLELLNRTVFLLDIKQDTEIGREVKTYLEKGENEGISKKYLPAHRKPWFLMEQKDVAPIWVSTACRNGLKFVRNLTNARTLTTFHSISINDLFKKYLNIIFCYFITPIAQELLRENRKELGNGLDKFQPNDLNSAKMLDISLISDTDIIVIKSIYSQMLVNFNASQVDVLNNIFKKYLKDF